MAKLLVVDDEPLVQIGIKSMLNWESFGISICGTAMNGSMALEMIEQYSPEIVITDIKMPIMNGLELVKICKERYDKLPLFIILTSYEEFSLIKEALRYQVVDYLVKLELNSESLESTIKRTLEMLEDIRKVESNYFDSGRPILQSFRDKFFIRLIHNLFEDEEQFQLQCKDLKLKFDSKNYIAAHCAIQDSDNEAINGEKQMHLYVSTLQMVREILIKHIECDIFPLDIKHFCILFYLDIEDTDTNYQVIKSALDSTYTMVNKYFNVTITTGIGRPGDSPLIISDSYKDARQAFNVTSLGNPIVFYNEINEKSSDKNAFNITMFKNNITKGFEEFDADVLHKTFTEIIELFRTYPTRYLQAIDGTCNILYLAIALHPEGEKAVSEIFSDYPDGYRSIYRQTSVEQVIDWLLILRDGLCKTLTTKKKTYKNHIVSSVEKYICKNIEEKLTLNDTAAVFGISSNYLSILFKKYGEMGFSEYITQQKIMKAKQLMENPNLKIYEIADQLGFESAFYFSKVFKKVEGISPREYQQHNYTQELTNRKD